VEPLKALVSQTKHLIILYAWLKT